MADPDLLVYPGTDDGFTLALTVCCVGIGEVGIKSMPLKFSDHSNWTIVGLREVPQVGLTLGLTLSTLPGTR